MKRGEIGGKGHIKVGLEVGFARVRYEKQDYRASSEPGALKDNYYVF